ncbi:hypothetical protein G6F37_004988 [Rhizopus arrhizus]|nr:hypothetical protein G6F38_005380 [Rhizopus arrhizus]KAG1159341.1 hypothetical protein G6F37_004988 [Rhizopus arrhizus]
MDINDIQRIQLSNSKENITTLVDRIDDEELKKAIQQAFNRLVSDHDHIVHTLQQDFASLEEVHQRRYEKAVREMQFFKRKYDKIVLELSTKQTDYDLPPLPPVPNSPCSAEMMKSRHLSRSSSSSTSSSSSFVFELPPVPPRIRQNSTVCLSEVTVEKVRKSSWSTTTSSQSSIIQQRKVDPIMFGGSDALWHTIANSKPIDPTLEKMISNFLRRGGSPNTGKQSPSFKSIQYGYGMLHAMVAIKASACMDLLIQHGANPNALTLSGLEEDRLTPAYLAASMGWLPGLQSLIEAGADLMAARGPKNKTALQAAAEHCHVSVVEYIISVTPVRYHTQLDATGANVLHYAAASGHADLVAYLVQTCQLPVDQADMRGETALHWASKLGHLEVASLLIERCGSDFNCYIPRKVNTPFDLAKAGNHKRLMDYYKKIGALTAKKMDKKREEELEKEVPIHLESALFKNGLFEF